MYFKSKTKNESIFNEIKKVNIYFNNIKKDNYNNRKSYNKLRKIYYIKG